MYYILTDSDIELISKIPYPHINKKIVIMWGSPELSTYLNKLLIDDRDTPRAGFAPEVSTAIFAVITRNELVLREAGNKPDIDDKTGHDWVNETGEWKIVKRK